MTLVATIVLLGVLIFVHELGHFWAAKSVGVGVERFSIGLGPKIWGFKRGETEYILAAIPLGGYVKMQGMEDEVMEHLEGGASDSPRTPRPGDYDAQPLAARAFVISAGVIMNMLFAFLLYTVIFTAWGVQKPAVTRVMTVEESTLPAGTESLAGITTGAEIVRVGEVVPASWYDIVRTLAESDPGPLQVETASPRAVFDIVVPAGDEERRALAASLGYWIDPVVGEIMPGSPAAAASIEREDRITRVAGAPVTSWADMLREIGARPGERVEIGLLRNGTALTRVVELDDIESATGERRGQLGVRINTVSETVTVPVGLGEAISLGWGQTVGITRRILDFLRGLVTLNVSPREVGSIGTIAQFSGEAARAGTDAYLHFMALLSINLAVLNLLPIPVLDGGHLVFLGIELVRGQKLSVKQRIRWSQVGMVVLVGIMVWALGNDLLRFLGL